MYSNRLSKTLPALLLCLALLSGLNAYGQASRLVRAGVELSSNIINDISCDRNGIVWVCTDNGINRLDAAKTRMLFSEQGNSNTFNYSMQDSKGRRWFCGADNIYLYDDATEKLTPIETLTARNERLAVRTSMIIETKDGNIYACSSGHGVLHLEEKDGKMLFRQFDLTTMKPLSKGGMSFFVSNLLQDRFGNVWVCSERGLFRISKGKITPVQCADESKYRHYSFISESKDGNVWVGNHAGGLWRINPQTLQVTEVPGFSNLAVECIVGNHKTEVLVGTGGEGVWQIDSKSLSSFRLGLVVGNVTDNRLNIHALCDDQYGNLWIGCYQKGIAILPKLEERFRYIGRNDAQTSIIGNGCVMSLGKDHDGRMWVAGDGDGLYAVKGMQSVHYAPSATMPQTVMSQFCDSKGRLWLGTWLQGLWVMSPSTGAASKVELPISGNSYSVFALTEDRKGRIWIGTLGEGIYVLDVNTGKIAVAPKAASGLEYGERKNVIPNNWVNDFSLAPDGMLYIATCDGIGAINTMTNDCLSAFKGKNRLFAGVNVNTVCYSKDHRLWVGTSRGLYSLNLKTLATKHYRHEEGLLGNMVQSIVDVGDGTLWISTNAGVAQLRLSDDHIVNYSSHNGMYGNEFSRNASAIANGGIVWFGGTEGVSFFNPKTVVKSAVKPRFYITGLYVSGNYVTAASESDGRSIMSTNIMNANEIDLAYTDNSFTLEFSTLNYMSNDGVNYEYRIDNGDWQSLPLGINTVSFSNMEAGKHKLTIRALQQGRYSDERVLNVTIRSPWYATWWAYLLYLAIVILAIHTIIARVRSRQANAITELKLRQQEEMSEAKLQFFTNISHEIRTPMTLIISPLQRLIGTDHNPEHQLAYQRMNRNAHRILQLVNQMLDVRKIDKGQMQLYYREVEMTSYVSSLVSGFTDLCDTKRIAIGFTSNVDSMRAWIDPMNFEKVIVNLVSNAYKYTPEQGSIHVLLTKGEKDYTIRVEDTGCGLNESEIDHIFDRFYQLRNSANRTGLSLGGEKHAIQGTGIGLNLTQSLVNLQHGTITCANNEEGKPGCHFVVTMPLGRDHLQDSEIDDTVEEVVEEKPVAVEVPAQPEVSKPKTRKRIFVVEDDTDINSYLKEELSRDFVVTTCNNGQEALTLLHSNQKCDLIISDVMMPVMDGLEMLRQIRQNTDLNSIPIILLTAKVTDKENIEGLECGADAYITKPFNIEVVRSTAKNLINRQTLLKNIYSGSQNPTVASKIKVMSPDEKLMQRIMKVINSNLANPELGNDLITREVGISRVHLYRKLKELTNLSLRDFIRNIRLNEAARLLSEQKHSVAEIAQRTGFDNVSYFTVVFKQKYGVPPSQYRGKTAETEEDETNVKPEQ